MSSTLAPTNVPIAGGWIGVTIESQAAPIAVTGSLSFSGAVDQGLGGASAWKVDGSAVTQPVSAAQLPAALSGGWLGVSIEAGSISLPPGIATSANQATEISSLASIDAGVAALVQAGQLPAALVGGRLDVNLGAQSAALAVSAASLPLPAGAATETTLASRAAGAQLPAALVGGRLSVDVGVSALPAGAAAEVTLAGVLTTAAFQARVATLGQKAMAGSMPVVLASDQSAIPVTIAASVAVTGPLTDTQLRAAAVPVSGPLTDAQLRAAAVVVGDGGGSLTVDGSVSLTGALPAGANTLGKVDQGTGGASAWKVDGSGVTQPVSAAALPLPTGAASETTLGTLLTTSAFQARVATLGQKAMAGSMPVALASDQSAIPVTGPLTDTQLRASAVPVSDGGGSLTVDAPVGTPVAVRLSDGAAFYDGAKTGQLPAALVGGRLDGNLGAWLGSTAPTVGQKTTAASIPVTMASDQTPILSSISNTGSSGGSSANPLVVVYGSPPDVAVDTWLGSNAPTVGQKTMASSLPVTIASNQSAVPVADGGGSLTVDTGQLPATLGQKAMAASMAVVVASDQSALPVTLPTLTKGTQGAQGASVQDLKDSGRTRIVISFEAAAPATADTLLSLVRKADGVAAAGATSIAVTAGKRLRITAVSFSVKAGAAAAAFATLTLRENPAGATVIGSPTWGRIDVGNTAAAIGAADKVTMAFPDGIEFSGANQIGASVAAQATTNVLSVELYGFEY